MAKGEGQNKSRAELYITSLAFIYRLNEWDTAPLLSLRARAPVQAAVSIFSTATRKSAPVRGWMIRDVLRLYCFGPSATLASIVFGAALAAMYHVWGRYDDATQLRYGGDSMVWHRNGPADSHWVDLYVNKHKNRQDGGTHHAIAASEGPSLGAFEALSLAFSRLHEIGVRAGFLLPGRLYLLDVPAQRSRAQWETHMTLDTFTGLLRNALLCIGMPSDDLASIRTLLRDQIVSHRKKLRSRHRSTMMATRGLSVICAATRLIWLR